MDTKNKMLKDWYDRVGITQKAHQYSVERFERRGHMLGIPTIVLTAIVGTSIFAAIGESVDIRLQIVAGLISVTAAVLASLQTFLGYAERTEKHRIAAAKYGALGRELEAMRVSSELANDETVADIRKRIDVLALESVNTPIPLYSKAWRNWEKWETKSALDTGLLATDSVRQGEESLT